VVQLGEAVHLAVEPGVALGIEDAVEVVAPRAGPAVVLVAVVDPLRVLVVAHGHL
jgi:hypothetical protein